MRIPPLQGLRSGVVLIFTGLRPVLLIDALTGLMVCGIQFFYLFDILSGHTMCY